MCHGHAWTAARQVGKSESESRRTPVTPRVPPRPHAQSVRRRKWSVLRQVDVSIPIRTCRRLGTRVTPRTRSAPDPRSSRQCFSLSPARLLRGASRASLYLHLCSIGPRDLCARAHGAVAGSRCLRRCPGAAARAVEPHIAGSQDILSALGDIQVPRKIRCRIQG